MAFKRKYTPTRSIVEYTSFLQAEHLVVKLDDLLKATSKAHEALMSA